MSSAWLGAAAAVLVAALPPPPETVVRQTKSFGTITIPHRAHLAQRVACRACHGPGQVGKIQFTPKAAHATCRNCHVELSRGPVECRGCHVVAPKPEATTVAAGASGADGRSFSVASASSHLDPGRRILDPSKMEAREITQRAHMSKVIAAGVVATTGQHQRLVAGPSVLLTARNGAALMQYGLSFAGGSGYGRTQFLIGGGTEWEVIPNLSASATVVAGLDATHSPVSIMPAIGLRTGLEISGRSPWTLELSAMGLGDVANRSSAGEQAGGITFVAGAAVGWRLR